MKKFVQRFILAMIAVVMIACGQQTVTKTIVLANGKKVAEISGNKTGIFVQLSADPAPGTVYHYAIGGQQQPASILGDFTSERQFIELQTGYWYIWVSAVKNGVTGTAYAEFYLRPLEILPVDLAVHFPTDKSGGIDVTITAVTAPTIYATPGAIYTKPIVTRGTVISVDLTHDWASTLNVGYLGFSSSSITPFTLSNCELQDLYGNMITDVSTVTLWFEYRDLSHTVTDYYSQINFYQLDYGLLPGVTTTVQVVCDISTNNQFLDFYFTGLGLADYSYFFLSIPISWANAIQAQ